MKILSIDYGTKLIGLAKWSSDVDVILPFGVVKSTNEVADLVKKEKFDKVIVGMPYSAEKVNVKNKNVVRVQKFIDQLQADINIKIEIVDERFSSQQADRMVGEATRDERSAMVILESYLQNQ